MARRDSGVGRLLARAGRPAVNPWHREPFIADVVGETAPTVASRAFPADEHPPPAPTPLLPVEEAPVVAGERAVAEPPRTTPERPGPERVEAAPVPADPRKTQALEPATAPAAHVTEQPLEAPPAVRRPDPTGATVLSRPSTSRRQAAEPASIPPQPVAPVGADEPVPPSHRASREPALLTAPVELVDRPPARREAPSVAPGPPVHSIPPEPGPSRPGLSQGADGRPEPAPEAAPTVVIDEIRIVTPPAPVPPEDPLASLAARRVGASRHRGGARWPA